MGNFKSGFERTTAFDLKSREVRFEYEPTSFDYVINHKYTPDFHLTKNNIYVETKGEFDQADRRKMLAIKEQHPGLDIRMVFMRGGVPITKGSKTTYENWCTRNGFLWAIGKVPDEWLT